MGLGLAPPLGTIQHDILSEEIPWNYDKMSFPIETIEKQSHPYESFFPQEHNYIIPHRRQPDNQFLPENARRGTTFPVDDPFFVRSILKRYVKISGSQKGEINHHYFYLHKDYINNFHSSPHYINTTSSSVSINNANIVLNKRGWLVPNYCLETCNPPPPPTYQWTIRISNDATDPNSEKLNLYIDGTWKESITITRGTTISKTYLVTEGVHSFQAMYLSTKILTFVRNGITKNIVGDRTDTVSLADPPEMRGTRYFDVILAETTDSSLTTSQKNQIRDQALLSAQLVNILYDKFSYNALTLQVRYVTGWYRVPLTTAQAKADHTKLWKEAITAADPYINFAFVDAVVVIFPGDGSATGFAEKLSPAITNDGNNNDPRGMHKIFLRVVIPSSGSLLADEWAWAHEFGHAFALGHPYLLEKYNALSWEWDLMGKNGGHMNSYYKWALHWLTLNLKNSGEVTGRTILTPLSILQFGDSILAYKTPTNSADEFYIIEYRDKDDPYDGTRYGGLGDIVVIYKTMNPNEVQLVRNDDFYDTIYNASSGLIDEIVEVMRWTEPVGRGYIIDTITIDPGFIVGIEWYEGSDPIITVNVT